jgi:hypothetical protein
MFPAQYSCVPRRAELYSKYDFTVACPSGVRLDSTASALIALGF